MTVATAGNEDHGDGRSGYLPGVVPLVGMALAIAFLAGAIGFTLGTREGQPSSADVGFLRDMIAHHEQAVSMATEVSRYEGIPPVIESTAEEVILFQRYEMGAMAAKLQTWGKSQNDDGPAMAWMDMPVDRSKMPGLATAEEMDRLASAQGDEKAALFIAMLSRHHLGGVQMAEEGAKRAEDPYVRDLARSIASKQKAEISELSAARQRLGLPVPAGFTDPPTLDKGGMSHGS